MRVSSKELLLLLLYAPLSQDGSTHTGIRGRTRFAKMVFLFRKEIWPKFRFDSVIPEDVLPDFIPWKFGPFSKDVFSDLDFLETVGLIEVGGRVEPSPPEEALELAHWSGEELLDSATSVDADEVGTQEFSEEIFRLSDDGVRYIEEKELWAALSDRQKDALREFKTKLVHAPLYSILKYVYSRYPDMTKESIIEEEVLR